MKKEMKSKTPKIDFHFIINSLNVKEVPDFIDWVATFNLPTDEFLILFTKILHPFGQVKDIFLDEVPLEIIAEAEKIITMGCEAEDFCPARFLSRVEDWGIEDPKGKTLDEVRSIRDTIHERVRELLQRLSA
jgi:hypothetical protein